MTKRSKSISLSRTTLVLLVVAVGMGAFTYGYLVRSKGLPPFGLVRSVTTWAKANLPNSLSRPESAEELQAKGRTLVADFETAGGTDKRDEAFEELLTLGYLNAYQAGSELSDVTFYDPELAYDGLNLCTPGNVQEATLIDMDGTVLHTWAFDAAGLFPNVTDPDGILGQTRWRRVYLYENGDILAIYSNLGVVKLDKDSNLIWSSKTEAHHDMFVRDDGSIYVLTHRSRPLSRINTREPVIEDFITVLDAEGNVLRTASLLEAFESSRYAAFLDKMARSKDLFHTNTVEVFDGSMADLSPVFAEGNVLISVHRLNVIAVLDPEMKTVVWALAGQWVAQHHPTLLEGGTIMLFDNRGHNGRSKVIEFDPFTQDVKWAYYGDDVNDFYSPVLGASTRVPNGNTLITESTAGRAFEVTPQNEIVWEYHNPRREGKNDELIATLFEVERIEREHCSSWLEAPTEETRR